MKAYKVLTSVGVHYVDDVTCALNACGVAKQELGEDVEIYDAIEVDEYEVDE